MLGPGGQGQNIDIVAVHSYADRASDTKRVMDALVPESGVANWHWPVWLTEVGLSGCKDPNTGQRRSGAPAYCVGPDGMRIDDDSLAADVQGVLYAMTYGPSADHWEKSFYWHAYDEIATAGEDWGILHGAASNALSPRPAYWSYTSYASPLTVSGPGGAYDETVTFTATPAVPGSYYYRWRGTWCYHGNALHDCDGSWSQWVGGQDVTTFQAYVHRQDYYVTFQTEQYAWQGGPLISSGEWTVQGSGVCTVPQGCNGDGGGTMAVGTTGEQNMADSTKQRRTRGSTIDPSAGRLQGRWGPGGT